MTKKHFSIILIFVLIISLSISVFATSASVSLNANTSSSKVGETFTVTLSANCAEGINGLAGIKYSYDSEKLELIKSDVKDSNFINMGSDNSIDLICNSSDKITSSDVYEFTFKIKDNVKLDSNATISISKFILDSDEATNSEVDIEARKIELSIGKDRVVSIKSNVTENSNSGDSSNSGFPVIIIIAVVVLLVGVFIISNSKNKKTRKSNKNKHSRK